jgi:hypothetical protein
VREYYNLEELWSEGKFEPVVNSTAPAPAARRRAPPRRGAGAKRDAA